MGRRKHIRWKTRCAAAVLAFNHLNHGKRSDDPWLIPYADAKQMTEDQFLSLFHWDHNMLHSSEHGDRDKFWNLTPLLIRVHREKTKTDAKVIAKSRRIRQRWQLAPLLTEGQPIIEPSEAEKFSQRWADYVHSAKPKRKIKSRGFDKSLRRKMSGKVVKREKRER